MKSRAKKYTALIMALSAFICCIMGGFSSFAVDSVAINEENFPDEVFRSIVQRYDKDANNELSADERQAVTIMSLTGVAGGRVISTLKGIEFFADSLSVLRCSGVELKELDVSALANLTALTCQGNLLTCLDVSHNSKLTTLNCADNMLTDLVLGSSDSLTSVSCYANNLEHIDVSGLKNLEFFKCDQNELTEIDVSANTKLNFFTCSMNHLTSLDLSNNTALTSITNSAIGDQTSTAEAYANGMEFVIPFEVDNEQSVTSSSLDKDGIFAYTDGEFVSQNMDDIKNGLDYTYSTGLEGSEDMSVHLDVTADFYQVSFYEDESMTNLLGRSFVNENETAYTPPIPTPPQCRAFDRWSEDITAVKNNMSVYIIWKDDHAFALTNFEDGIATVSCGKCGDSYTAAFSDSINAEKGSDNYLEFLDVVNDGCINAKDYAKLIKMF